MSGAPLEPPDDRAAVHPVPVIRHGGADGDDFVAVERALEVRINGQPFAAIMRTPGADADLALGFLFAEGLLRGPGDIDRVDEAGGDVVNVVTARARADAVADALAERRPVAVNASCGVCGRPGLESLARGSPCAIEWAVAPSVVTGLPSALGAAQAAFAKTGGLHAAGLFDLDGRLGDSAEDVGRHNAVDKLLGRTLRAGGLPLGRALLLVSGRVSFEIVQKAWAGGIPLVAAVSAPSSLAVSLADRAGITLIGFLRGERFNVYSHRARIETGRG